MAEIPPISRSWWHCWRALFLHRPVALNKSIAAQWRNGQIAVVGPPEGQAGDDGGPSAEAAAQPVQGLSIFRSEYLHHLLPEGSAGDRMRQVFGRCCSLMCELLHKVFVPSLVWFLDPGSLNFENLELAGVVFVITWCPILLSIPERMEKSETSQS